MNCHRSQDASVAVSCKGGSEPEAEIGEAVGAAGCGASRKLTAGDSVRKRGPASNFHLALVVAFGVLVMGPLVAEAQLRETGTVTGEVVDSMQGEPVPGVVVSVRGTTLGTTTDEQGRYTIADVPPGDHILIFSKSGFERATVADVRVLMGQTSRAYSRLSPDFYEMDTYEVVARLVDDEFGEILFERQNALQLMDSIGSDFISRVGASDAAGAVARVTGVTVAEGRYAVIRGLADRYTFTTLNGLELPSADPERRAVQLDLYPAQAIERVEVTKTFTPDQPGNTTGGRVNIVTKSFPEQFTFSVKVGAAYNTQATLNDDFSASPTSGSTDWLGIDDGTRALPDGFQQISWGQLPPLPAGARSPEEVQTRTELNRSLNKGFAPVSSRAPFDTKFSIFIGDTTTLFGRPLGLLGSFSYDRRFRNYDDGRVVRRDSSGIVQDLVDSRGVESVLWGALAGVAYELHDNHTVDFTFAYNQSSDSEARGLKGFDENAFSIIGFPEGSLETYVLDWTERNVTSFQFKGDHYLPDVLDMQIDWGASFSSTTEETPDLRQMAFFEEFNFDFVNPGFRYRLDDNSFGLQKRPTAYWRDLEGDNMNLTFDDTVPFSLWSGLESLFKFGAYYSASEQIFNERAFTFASDNAFGAFGQEGDPNNFLAESSITPNANDRYGVYVIDFSTLTTYEGTLNVPAAYLMTDLALVESLNFVGGVRVERTEQEVTTTVLGNPSRPTPTTQGQIEATDWLPAAGLIYSVIPSMNIRLNYGRTVARPTFREFSDAQFVDFAGGNTFQGNPDLDRSLADNFDLRWEWFPEPGDVLAASVFYKNIQNPIELKQTSLDGTISYDNSEKADVYGLELELRKNLGFLHSSLRNFSLGANYAYIRSEVPRDQDELNFKVVPTDPNRPLFDQPTYVFNTDLTYDNPNWGTTATLSFNITGRRLVRTELQNPDVYQEPTPVLNFTVSQRLWDSWKIGFSAKNLLDPTIKRVYDFEDDSIDNLFSEFSLGMTFGMTLSYEF